MYISICIYISEYVCIYIYPYVDMFICMYLYVYVYTVYTCLLVSMLSYCNILGCLLLTDRESGAPEVQTSLTRPAVLAA